MTDVSAILLAAGGSTRFGRPKMLAEVDGMPLVRRTAAALLDGGVRELVAVLGAGAPDVARALAGLPLKTVVNDTWERGMFSSVVAGLDALGPDAERVAVSPADLPFLTSSDVARTLTAAGDASPRTLVVAAHGERRGHPLVFHRLVAERLHAWPDTRRLSELFAEPDLTTVIVDCGPGVMLDADVPSDLLARP
jgi:molybdenum cofactor cytidylyltransferase